MSDRTSQVKVSHFEVRLRPDTNPEYAPLQVKVSDFEVRLRPDTNPEYALPDFTWLVRRTWVRPYKPSES